MPLRARPGARCSPGLRWKRIAAVAGGIFVVAMLVIVSFELVTGRAVSTYTGGSDSGPAPPSRVWARSTGPVRRTRPPPRPRKPTQQPSASQPSTTPSSAPSARPRDAVAELVAGPDAPSAVPSTPAPSSRAQQVPTPTEVATPAGRPRKQRRDTPAAGRPPHQSPRLKPS